MLAELSLIEGAGWTLKTDADIKPICDRCYKDMSLGDFFFCKNTKKSFCRKCTHNKRVYRPCDCKENYHELYHIIQVVKVGGIKDGSS